VARAGARGGGAFGDRQGLIDLCRSAQVGRAVHDRGDVGEGVSEARGRGAQSEEARAASELEEATRRAGEGDPDDASASATLGQPPHPRFDEEVFGDRHLRDDGAASAEVRRHKGANHTEARAAQAGGPALRAGRAQPVVAVGPVYVSPAAARTNLCRCVPGRSLPLPREPGDGASPKKRAGAGGVVARDRRLWGAAGDPDRSGPAVHRLARVDGVRSGVEASWHRACEEPAASPADLREDRAVLEDAVGGAALTHGVRRLRGLPTAGGALHPALQLPAAAPGAGGLDACGSVLPRRQPGAREHRGASGRERAAPGAGATAEKALLSCWPARGSHPLHQRERRGPQRAGGR